MDTTEEFKLPPEWGVKLDLDPNIKPTSLIPCERCGRSLIEWGRLLVGYTHISLKTKTRPGGVSEGMFIIQCLCSRRYYFHATVDAIDSCRFLCQIFPEEWKWPRDENGEPL